MLANGDSILGPVGGDLRPDNAAARNEAPDARVARLRAVVAEHEITVVRNDSCPQRVLSAPAVLEVVLLERAPVDEDAPAAQSDPLAGQPYDPVDEGRPLGRPAPCGARGRQLVGDDVTAFRVADLVEDFRDQDPIGLVAAAPRDLAAARAVQRWLHRGTRDAIQLRGHADE